MGNEVGDENEPLIEKMMREEGSSRCKLLSALL